MLPDAERHSLAVWLSGLDDDEWDTQMVQDFSPGGRGVHLLEKVKTEIAAGKFRPVEEILRRGEAEARVRVVSRTSAEFWELCRARPRGS